MTQNLQRFGWLVPYLFGSSPAVCSTFLADGEGQDLESVAAGSRAAPYGTSLRLGNIGYRYRDDPDLDVSVRHTSFEHYVDDIIGHVLAPHPAYEALGLYDAAGKRQQLTANRLQIENEFYSAVRPKQIPEAGEFPIQALQRRGIRYLELRTLDVNPFHAIGIGAESTATVELLLLYAWLCDAAPLPSSEMDRIAENVRRVAHEGRKPGLLLNASHGEMPLDAWANGILEQLLPLADWLDTAESEPRYRRALDEQLAKVANPDLTPSARLLARIEQHGGYRDAIMALGKEQHSALLAQPEDATFVQAMEKTVAESFKATELLEANSEGSFENFLDNYYATLQEPGHG